jgi:hypothetical protein
MMEYIRYNREERDICAHLFRLLLEDQPEWGPLKEFLGKETIDNPRIFCEAAILRDAYYERKPHISQFISDVCDIIAQQNEIKTYRTFSELPEEFRNPNKTHPKQIKFKMKNCGKELSEADRTVYGSLQAMFNAKPDLVICEGNNLYVYEAKYTLGFDQEQLKRTEEIAEVWKKILFRDLGFKEEPDIQIRKLGLDMFRPNISWEKILEIARKCWGEADFSVKVFSKVLDE